ncbi:oligosaccharyl transferase glycoprotein complex, beta subunit [Myotisia sp. PD_48]|nr:oligosaccharyl transferase glycoprotein complex, beta subunit [Myotisia sp. PD_48]
MHRLLAFLCLCIYSVTVYALSSSGNRLLVIQEDASEKASFSTFWADLESRGYQLSFFSPKNEHLSLFHLGNRAFDHLIILPPKSKGLGPALAPKAILDFVNTGGNVLLPLSGASSTSSAINSLLLELDIHLSPDRSPVLVDHFNYDAISSAELHDVLLVPRPAKLRSDTKDYFSGDGILALPKVAGQSLGVESPLLVPILRAPPTTYSYDTKDDELAIDGKLPTGSQLSLVSAMQARNSARVTVLGSVDSLKDDWFSAEVQTPNKNRKTKNVNREFAQQVTAWTFKERGVIKVGRVEHYLNEEVNVEARETNPAIYRIKNDVTFNIELSEYDGDKWTPFEVPENDALQLEFTMLSPFHRLNLAPISKTSNSTIYSASFKLPDQHGIFSFRVNYKRPFLTNIEEKHEVTVRHFAHDEWPRSWRITGGWVWIAGLWSVIGGFIAFVFIWLYSAPPMQKDLTKKSQ